MQLKTRQYTSKTKNRSTLKVPYVTFIKKKVLPKKCNYVVTVCNETDNT